jgi:outer membrane protein assembly factor BamD
MGPNRWRPDRDFATSLAMRVSAALRSAGLAGLVGVAPLLLLLVCAGCESFEIAGAKHATLTYTDDARLAYGEALKAYQNKDWEDAKALFGEVKKLFAYSRYARMAELRLCDIEFETDKLSEAITGYREFIQSHKNDPDLEYARYRITKALFKDIDDTVFLPPQEERDQATAQEAYKEIKSFVRDYPRTRYLKDELYMFEVIVGRLVRHELYVARYYLRNEAFPATVARIDYALKTFPGSNLEPEALVLKGETLMKMKRLDEAAEVFETVRKDYGGPFVVTAGRFLDEVKDLRARGRPGKPEDPPKPPDPSAPK